MLYALYVTLRHAYTHLLNHTRKRSSCVRAARESKDADLVTGLVYEMKKQFKTEEMKLRMTRRTFVHEELVAICTVARGL